MFMKKNLLLLSAVVFGGVLILALNTVLAQNPPPAGAPASPGFHPPTGSPAARARNEIMLYRRTASYLKNAKQQLQRSTEDYNGHRQSAIDACDKAMQELTAVAQSIDDAAKAAAAASAPAAGAPANPAPTTPPPATTPNQ
jgi:hypothetical protein